MMFDSCRACFLVLLGVAWPLQSSLAASTVLQTAVTCSDPTVGGARLHVTALGARRVAGNITFTLYGEDRSRFLAHHGSIALTRVTLAGPSAETCFAVSTPGTYAVAVYHDENDNHHFDRTLLGLPAEGYGFSNDAPTTFGLPSFDSVKLVIPTGDTHILIHLKY